MVGLGRLFVAVGIPDRERSVLAQSLERWNEGKPLPGRPVPPENWHLTLRFLGETEEVAFERISAFLDQLGLGPPFKVSLAGLGAFPNPHNATVLWVGVTRGVERLTELSEWSEEAAQQAGFEPEDRPFKPHMTLSRIRPHQDLRAMLEREAPPPVTFEATEVTVYRSHLGRGGARYEPIETFPLG